MRVLCIGGGPAGLYLGLLLKKADPAHAVRVVERNRPYDTFGWGVVFSDQTLGNLAARRPGDRARDRGRVQPLGRHRRPLQGPHGHVGRPRFLRHRPQAAAQHPAGALRGARRRARVRDGRDRRRRGRARIRRRRGHRVRRPQQPHPHALRGDVRARRRRAPLPLRVARHAASSSPRSRSRSSRRSTAGSRRMPTSTTATRRRSSSRRRRRRGARPVSSAMAQEEGIAFCERLFAPWLDGHPLLSNAAHLRGSAIWIRFPRVVCRTWVHWNAIDGRERAGDPHGRRRAHRALLGGLGHQARARGRDRARRAPCRRPCRLRDALAAYEAERVGRGAEDPERRAQLDGVVRERQALHGVRGAAVRLQPADAQPAHLAREPAAARPRLRRGHGALVRARASRPASPCRRCSRRSRCAA